MLVNGVMLINNNEKFLVRMQNRNRRTHINNRLTENKFRMLENILDEVERRADAGPFLTLINKRLSYEDVGVVALYYRIIENPLAFSVIRKRIDNKLYYSTQEFLDDFMVILNNCIEFNGFSASLSDAISDIYTFVVGRVNDIDD